MQRISRRNFTSKDGLSYKRLPRKVRWIMLKTDEVSALANWIQNGEKTYDDNPKLNECITWFEWKYQDRELTLSDRSSIATILRYNSED